MFLGTTLLFLLMLIQIHTQKLNFIPQLTIEIRMIYHFEVLWAKPKMSDLTHLIFINPFACLCRCLPTYKKSSLYLLSFLRYCWFITLKYFQRVLASQTIPIWYLRINFVASMDMPKKTNCMVPILGVIHLVPGFMPLRGRRLFLQVPSWC